MASPRLTTSILLRASRSAISHTSRRFRALPIPSRRPPPPPLCSSAIAPQTRTYSTPTTPSSSSSSSSSSSPSSPSSATTPTTTPQTKIYTFPEIQHLSETRPGGTTLVDTREPGEVRATGTIPGSVNIPITSRPDSFFITPEEFEDRFGFEMPGQRRDGEGRKGDVVFFCRSGVRSRAAAALARQAGWVRVAEYPGSWLDWEKNGGRVEGGGGGDVK